MFKFNSLSVCIPAHNEEKTLRESVKDILQTMSPYIKNIELIIVSDGSTDRTPDIAEELAREYKCVKTIEHEKKSGIGVCYRDALKIATGEYFTWFPADHEDPASNFIRYLPFIDNETVVTCHRRGQDPRSSFRMLLSYVYTWTLNIYSGLHLKYYNGTAIYPVSVLRSMPIHSRGILFSAEILIRAHNLGCRIIEVPAVLKKRTSGKSKILTPDSVIQILQDIALLWKNKIKMPSS